MGYAVELYFDQDSEKMIMDLFGRLESECLNYNARPHISLSVHEDIDVDECIKMVREVFSDVRKIPLRLSSVGVFKGESNVLFIAPDANDLLTDLHSKFHTLLQNSTISTSEYYSPESWVPHCTIDFDIPLEGLGDKEKIAHENFHPFQAQIAGVGIVKFKPFVEIFSMHLHL